MLVGVGSGGIVYSNLFYRSGDGPACFVWIGIFVEPLWPCIGVVWLANCKDTVHPYTLFVDDDTCRILDAR